MNLQFRYLSEDLLHSLGFLLIERSSPYDIMEIGSHQRSFGPLVVVDTLQTLIDDIGDLAYSVLINRSEPGLLPLRVEQDVGNNLYRLGQIE